MSNASPRRTASCITPTVFCVMIAACASTPVAAPDTATAPASSATAPQAGGMITSAITSPLNDLNLAQTDIPAVLLDAQKHPYATPADASCGGLVTQARALDSALGADLDVPPSTTHPGLLERGGNFAGAAAGSALKGAAEGLVPFRSWVRRLSGAEQHSREVAAAIAAGAVRRAYLKGLGQSQRCDWPAAPLSTQP